jgi:S1-C subfamily serine protease
LSYTNLTDSFCTVVVIAPEKALTAKHCVPQGLAEDAPEIVVRKDGHEFKVTSVMHDAQGRDLALIKVEGLGCPCAIPAEFPALQDEAVMIVGYPYGIGPITTFGHVQIRTGLQDWDEHTYLLVTAKAGPGNSGGPLFVIRNGQPYLIGIVVLGIGGPHLTGAVELP